MKKIVLSILVLAVVFAFFSCKAEEQPIEKSIDGIAKYMGFTNGKDIPIRWDDDGDGAGAKAGKIFDFEHGKVTIYEFDPDSKEYEYWKTQTTDCVEGFVLMYEYDDSEELTDDEIMTDTEKLDDIKFKTE